MAANNYFGFAHGSAQYSAPAAAGYQAGQPGFAVGPAQSFATTPRAGQAAYDGFPGSHTTAAFGYAARQQEAAPPPPATGQTYESFGYPRTTGTTYDGTKAFFQQSQGSFSGGKTAFSSNSNFTNSTRAPTASKQTTPTYGYQSAPGSSNFASSFNSNPATTTASFTGSSYSGYDAALYSAATMYVQQQQGNSGGGPKTQGGWGPFKKPGLKLKPKQPPKPQQLHYCDVCKISCAGPQTYREHLEGQKHKKKEAAAKGGAAVQQPRGSNSLRCELCDVTCTGADAYAAHIRGAKHQKVVKLHTKLGKPIPSTEPTVVGGTNSTVATVAGKTATTVGNSTAPAAATTAAGAKLGTVANAAFTGASTTPVGPKKVIVPPKINFVGGTKLCTTAVGGEQKEDKPEEMATEESKLDALKLEEKDVQPVGQDYIEEIKNDEGKVISFQCKLCECRFNDPNAKEMHMKGRRHRLQYKKKVNPDLVVDIKPSLRQRKLQEEKMRRQQMKDEFWRRREEERWREEMRLMEEEERSYWEERRRYEEEMEHYEWVRRFGRAPGPMVPPPRPFPGQGPPPVMPSLMMRRPDTSDDRHVLAKHAQIYPSEDELEAVQKIVSNCEKALKGVSDSLAEGDASKENVPVVKKEPAGDEEVEKKPLLPAVVSVRVLKGVMRVGLLAKGLLLRGDVEVNLVVLCAEKPTLTLLNRVVDLLPLQLAEATTEKYDIKSFPEEASFIVMATSDPIIRVTVTLTSPVIRDTNKAESGESVNVKDPPDVLDRQKCLDALAALRHAKWFQARASGLQSCVMIIRILRDLCQRVPTWSPLNIWAMELLVEKVLASAGHPLSPGDALRRVLEAISSGILLPGGSGIMDPCEKDPVDAGEAMTRQEREDITASAQHALRLVAFRQIHKVLGMDQLVAPKFQKGRFARKRRRDNSGSEGNECEGADGKKDKKDEDAKTDSMETQESSTILKETSA